MTCTIVSYDLLKEFNLTINEYLIVYTIYKFGHKSNPEMSKAYGLSKGAISDITNRLIKRGFLKRVFEADDCAMMKLGADLSVKSGCVVCGSKRYLHEHHYPIRKKDGGSETVTMCMDHHIAFHQLTDHGILLPALNINFP